MRNPPVPTGTPRSRGAIRTHLGRRRVTGRERGLDARQRGTLDRRAREDLFDRLLASFHTAFELADEHTAAAFDGALDDACGVLLAEDETDPEVVARLRECLRRDLLHRDHPSMTFRSDDVTTAGTLTCEGCGWTILTGRTTLLPPCPQCSRTTYRKTA